MSSTVRELSPIAGALAATIGVALSGCATQPIAEPHVVALPRQGESFQAFEQHDVTCRQFAAAQTGGRSPGQAAATSGTATAATGTVVGAAAGALLGSTSGHAGNGAAIGAGSGLLLGGLFGSESGREAAASTQKQYDVAYTQCMVANGELIAPPAAPVPQVVYRPAPPAVIYVPAPAYVSLPPPAYPPPSSAPVAGSFPPPATPTQPSGR